MIKNFRINKIIFYLFQSVIIFKTLIYLFIIFFLFINITSANHLCSHGNNLIYKTTKVENIQNDVSKLNQVPKPEIPTCDLCSCECSEHFCKHIAIEMRNFYIIKSYSYYQEKIYSSKIFILEKFISEFFRPPIN